MVLILVSRALSQFQDPRSRPPFILIQGACLHPSFQSTLSTRLSLSRAYHLEMDGRVERVNKVMKDILRTYFMDQ